jgi:cell division protein ZapA (FtsZ GTPase activity inhibitor)
MDNTKMDNASIVVPIDIAGKKYDIKCPQHEKLNLLKAAAVVQKYMDKINNPNSEKNIIMTALKLSHELISKEDKERLDATAQANNGLDQVTCFIDSINSMLTHDLQKNQK